MPDNPVITIQKLTVRYDEREDRLLLAAKCDTGDVRGLWLTQRLATPLIRVVLQRLAQERGAEASAASAGGASSGAVSTLRQAALQKWEQSAAHTKQLSSASAPVSVPADVQHGLINEINVICRPDGSFQLNFRLPDAAPLCLPLTAMLTRQWLAVLRAQYQRADWHAPGLWPNWFEAAGRPEGAESTRVH